MGEFLGLSEDELQLFLDETGEHVDTLEAELLRLERGETHPEQLDLIFRAAHTVKGSSAAVGLEGMARLTHTMETLFDRMRSGRLVAGPAVTGPLLVAVDALRTGLEAVRHGELPGDPPPALLQTLAAAAEGGTAPAGVATAAPAAVAPAVATPAAGAELTVRVRIAPDCPMPAVRALQVLLGLEGLGTVLASQPTQAEVEAEQVRESLTVWLQSSADPAMVQGALRGIPDLVSVDVQVSRAGEPAPAAGGDAGLGPGPAAAGAAGSAATPRESGGGHGPAAPRDQAPGVAGSGAPAGAEPGSGGRAAGGGGREDRTIRVDVALLDDLMNLVGELVIDRGRLAGLAQTLRLTDGAQDLAEELGRVTGHVARVTGRLQDTVLKARMLPIERVFRKFPRMVRDLAQQMGKSVDFRVAGEETELDRSLLEVLSDPLVHLLRNALDHGIEAPEERRRAGKPETSTLLLTAAQEESHVVILLRDDGRGMDPEKIKAAAVRKGLLTPERARELTEHEVIDLVFTPGFSTAERVTDLSGRGVGLDVVRKNIERVGGRIEVESRPGTGTAFRLILPLTLATTQALLVQCGGGTFALPLSAIVETLLVAPEQIDSIKGHWVTRVRGNVAPLLWVEQWMSPSFRPGRPARPLLVVLVSHKGERVGLVVDRLVGQQEVVVKGLGEFFGQVRGVSGVTILGDGSLALILDAGGLIALLASEGPAIRSAREGFPWQTADRAS